MTLTSTLLFAMAGTGAGAEEERAKQTGLSERSYCEAEACEVQKKAAKTTGRGIEGTRGTAYEDAANWRLGGATFQELQLRW